MSNNFEERREELAQKVQQLVQSESKEEKGAMESNPEINSEAVQDLSTSEQVSELSDIEKQAHALGWRPQGQYTGNHFVPADEYVRRQPLFERIDRQSSELKELRNANQAIAQHLSTLRKEAYEQALKDLESKRIQSMNDGNTTQALATERQIKDMEIKRTNDPLVKQAEVVQQPMKHAEVDSFESRNSSWYNTNTTENRRMVEAANLVDRQLAEQAHERNIMLDPKEHLRLVEESVRRNFPHRFENPKKEAPSMVGRSTSSKEISTGSSLVSKLDTDQRKMGEYFVRSTKNLPQEKQYTLEKYAKELQDLGRLK